MTATNTVRTSALGSRPALKYAHERITEMLFLGSAAGPLITHHENVHRLPNRTLIHVIGLMFRFGGIRKQTFLEL